VIDDMDGYVKRIDQIFVHPSFVDPNIDDRAQYDAAMVKVVENLILHSGWAEAKALADDSENYPPWEYCVLAGFSQDPVTNGQPPHLSYILMPIMSREACENYRPVPRNMICASVTEKDVMPCPVSNLASILVVKLRLINFLCRMTREHLSFVGAAFTRCHTIAWTTIAWT
jgi:Trypsin